MAIQAEILDQPIDAFILFNEGEEAVVPIVDQLVSRGISTHFWRRDIKPGESWVEVERARLTSTRAVVVFLGDRGWGPTHLQLALDAVKLGKRIVPVLVGDPPRTDFEKADGIFVRLRYVDLRKQDPTALDLLVRALLPEESATSSSPPEGAPPIGRPGERAGRFDGLIGRLLDGDEESRSAVLEQVIDGTIRDKPGLAARLRYEIENNSAVRDPNLMPSIRSWMFSVLIWSDGASDASRQLILRHLNEKSETERNVRFWILVGLQQCRVGYVEGAIQACVSDPMPEVALLAQAMLARGDKDSGNSGFVDRLRKMLSSTNFRFETWPALRVLRVMPILPLAADLSSLSDRATGDLAYDALYALANPEMAAAAAPILQEKPGLERVLDIIVEVMRDADAGATRHFANLLAAFDAASVERAMVAAEAGDQRISAAIGVLRRHLAELRRLPIERPQSYMAGYASDGIDVTRDDLDIREDVQTLTAVMLARDVVPPLAIGLFGDWGAGKSFFMRSMKDAAKEISDHARNTKSNRFCTDVVSIEFNAWHYVDTNLWASLVSHIMESLADYVIPPTTPEQRQAELVQQLGSAKEVILQIQNEQKKAEEQISVRQNELQQLQIEREQKEIELRNLQLTDLRTLLATDPVLQKELKAALADIGVPAVLTSFADLDAAVGEVNSLRGKITGLVVGLFEVPKDRRLWLLAAVMLALPFLYHWLYPYIESSLLLLGAILGEVVAVVTAAAGLLRKAAGYVREKLDGVEAAKRKVEEALATRRNTPTAKETDLQKEIAGLKVSEQQAASRLQAATEKVIDLERQIATLKESRSLARFLTERTKSDDYRKHLGVISTIRQDFETLTKQLTKPDLTSGSELRKVERIILYVDDLDRCPTEKVVQVLEAVHLLLAYPLFVVVVGVDPRWLSYSLTSIYPVLQQVGTAKTAVEPSDGADIWRPTPQNYLEKIFQIPFSLRPMTRIGYGKLVEGLLSSAAPKPRQDAAVQAPPPSSSLESLPVPGASNSSGNLPPNSSLDAPQSEQSTGEKAPAAVPSFAIHDDAMKILPWEEMFAKQLFGLLPTPRATKRFSNIYRLLKAPISPDQLRAFEGTDLAPGTFQIPMLLLAILIGMPADAAKMFPVLYDRTKDGSADWTPAEILQFASPTLREKISDIVTGDSFPRSPALFESWLRRVSRFSFEIGRTIKPASSSNPA